MTPNIDPDDLTLSNHAMNRVKERNITAYQIKQAIRDGEPDGGAKKPHQIRFRDTYPGADLLVLVDPRKNKIVSVYYDDEQGAVGGSL